MGAQVIDQLLAGQQSAHPQVPPEVWAEMRAQFDDEGLLAITAAVWTKHFTREDILGLIEFYQSPVGAKLVEKQPAILSESMAAGRAWGEEIARRMLEALRKKGYLQEAKLRGGARSRRTSVSGLLRQEAK